MRTKYKDMRKRGQEITAAAWIVLRERMKQKQKAGVNYQSDIDSILLLYRSIPEHEKPSASFLIELLPEPIQSQVFAEMDRLLGINQGVSHV